MPRGKLDNLPKRKCDNCGASYQPAQPLREGQRGFHSANCRKEYHKHGGTFGKLKPVIEAEVRRRIKQLNPADAEAYAALEKRLARCERIIDALSAAFRTDHGRLLESDHD